MDDDQAPHGASLTIGSVKIRVGSSLTRTPGCAEIYAHRARCQTAAEGGALRAVKAALDRPAPGVWANDPGADFSVSPPEDSGSREVGTKRKERSHMRTIQEIETWYGQPLYDSGGSKIGEISDSLIEGETGQPAWLTVKTGGFGKKESLVPVHGASPSGDGVRVPYDEAQIKDAPTVKPDQELSDDDVRQLYAHYALDFGTTPTDDAGAAPAAGGTATPEATIAAPQQPFSQADMGG